MSANTESDDERPTLGSRENYWGGSEEPTSEAYDVSEHEGTAVETTHAGVARDKWIAGSILRGAPETSILCPECWSELSDPEHYVSPSEVELEDGETEIRYTDHRKHRECPSCSEISWGGMLADVEAETFLTIVDRVLDALDHELRSSTSSELRDAAARRKSSGLSDEANLERLLVEIRMGVADVSR